VPTYAYACTECAHRFEAVQSFTDDSLTVCPVCGGRLRKVFNAVGVVFKGSGFYRNDSRAKSGAASGTGESLPASGDGTGDKVAAKGSDGAGKTAGPDTAAASPAARSERSGGSERSGRSERSERSEPRAGKDAKPRAAATSVGPASGTKPSDSAA